MDVAPVAAHVREHHSELVGALATAAEAATDEWPESTDADVSGRVVRETYGDALRAAGHLEALPRVLVSAVDAAGAELRARPVPAPPYVVVVSHGVLLRATIDQGRLVVELRVFERTGESWSVRDAPLVSARLHPSGAAGRSSHRT